MKISVFATVIMKRSFATEQFQLLNLITLLESYGCIGNLSSDYSANEIKMKIRLELMLLLCLAEKSQIKNLIRSK